MYATPSVMVLTSDAAHASEVVGWRRMTWKMWMAARYAAPTDRLPSMPRTLRRCQWVGPKRIVPTSARWRNGPLMSRGAAVPASEAGLTPARPWHTAAMRWHGTSMRSQPA